MYSPAPFERNGMGDKTDWILVFLGEGMCTAQTPSSNVFVGLYCFQASLVWSYSTTVSFCEKTGDERRCRGNRGVLIWISRWRLWILGTEWWEEEATMMRPFVFAQWVLITWWLHKISLVHEWWDWSQVFDKTVCVCSQDQRQRHVWDQSLSRP